MLKRKQAQKGAKEKVINAGAVQFSVFLLTFSDQCRLVVHTFNAEDNISSNWNILSLVSLIIQFITPPPEVPSSLSFIRQLGQSWTNFAVVLTSPIGMPSM